MRHKSNTTKSIPWLLIVSLAILIVGIIAAEIFTQTRFKRVNKPVEKISTEIITSLSGIEYTISTNGSQLPYFTGAHLVDLINCIDVRCPQVVRQWFVPVEPGSEERLIKSIVESQGYAITDEMLQDCNQLDKGNLCTLEGKKDQLALKIGITSLSGAKAPSEIATPKQWRLLEIRSYDE